MSHYYRSLEEAPTWMRNVKQVVMEFVRKDGTELVWASRRLKKDVEVVEVAIKNENERGGALRYASRELKNNKGIVMMAVKRWGLNIRWASIELKNDRDVVLAAVTSGMKVTEMYPGIDLYCPDCYKYASDALRGDLDIVYAAARRFGMTIENAHRSVQYDGVLVTIAVKQCLGVYKKELESGTNEIVEVDEVYNEEVYAVKAFDEMGWFVRRQIKKGVINENELIHIAAVNGLRWTHGMKELIEENRGGILQFVDEETGLFPFMTMASSSVCDTSTLFELIKCKPEIVFLR